MEDAALGLQGPPLKAQREELQQTRESADAGGELAELGSEMS